MKKTLLKGMMCAGALMMGAMSANSQTLYVPGGFSASGVGSSSVAGYVGIGTGISAPKELLQLGTGFAFHDGGHKLLAFNYSGWTTTRLTNGYVSLIRFDSDGNIKFDFAGSGNANTAATLSNGVTFTNGGLVGIGTWTPGAKLHVVGDAILTGKLVVGASAMSTLPCAANLKMFVNGTIGATEVRVNTTTWCDYVFDNTYKLKSLSEVESFIKTNKHLPEVPSEKEVVENGVAVGEMMKIHMKKIEELTLYMIELKKENEKLAAEVAGLKK